MSLLSRTRRTLDAIRWSVQARREARLSPRERVERRDERVREVVAFAYREVPFYREAIRQRGLEPGDLRVAEDLALLPILEAGDVKDRESDLLPRGREPGELIDLKTSGSSGVPRTVYHDVRGALQVVAVAGSASDASWPGRWVDPSGGSPCSCTSGTTTSTCRERSGARSPSRRAGCRWRR